MNDGSIRMNVYRIIPYTQILSDWRLVLQLDSQMTSLKPLLQHPK